MTNDSAALQMRPNRLRHARKIFVVRGLRMCLIKISAVRNGHELDMRMRDFQALNHQRDSLRASRGFHGRDGIRRE